MSADFGLQQRRWRTSNVALFSADPSARGVVVVIVVVVVVVAVVVVVVVVVVVAIAIAAVM
jgi:ABC-type lipoprotein release transport system permease subunit